MTQKPTTRSVRIDESLFKKLRVIARYKGQTMLGYINMTLAKQIDKDFSKLQKTLNEEGNDI